ncbi:MAG: hypothetical protein KatS3mg090_0559 [Patescibacteria group bacterium]|nr:MAG: hypothetical protein KatS3mg090_0559 [Patescibacteria group bacterium]
MGDFNKIFAIVLGGIITIAILVFIISRLTNFFKGANFQLPKVFQTQTEPTPTPTPFETIVVETKKPFLRPYTNCTNKTGSRNQPISRNRTRELYFAYHSGFT